MKNPGVSNSQKTSLLLGLMGRRRKKRWSPGRPVTEGKYHPAGPAGFSTGKKMRPTAIPGASVGDSRDFFETAYRLSQ